MFVTQLRTKLQIRSSNSCYQHIADRLYAAACYVALYRQVAFLWNTQCHLWHQCPALQARSGHPVPCHATQIQMGTSTALPSLALFARLSIGGQRHAPAALPPGKNFCTHCIGGWKSVRADVNGAEKREFLSPPGFES